MKSRSSIRASIIGLILGGCVHTEPKVLRGGEHYDKRVSVIDASPRFKGVNLQAIWERHIEDFNRCLPAAYRPVRFTLEFKVRARGNVPDLRVSFPDGSDGEVECLKRHGERVLYSTIPPGPAEGGFTIRIEFKKRGSESQVDLFDV